MKNKSTHFAIYIDNMDRAKKFYSKLFGWEFNSFGSSGFLQIKTDKSENSELIGALQARKYSPIKEKIIGFECSIEVDNVDDIIETIIKNDGEIVMPKTVIPYIGWLTKFLDTEGNILCAIQYDNSAK